MLTATMPRLSKKRVALLLGLTALSLLWYPGCAPTTYRESGVVQSDVDDVEYLSAYGEWGDVQPFGMVWRPDVVADWEPFYYGHWVWTNDGWAWVSYEPYGWLVYHYGYWDFQPDIGWFWVPGDTWSPAQVQWYTLGDYYAWAPLPPPNVFWPEPWEPYQINIWIVVDADKFTNENIGRYRIVEPLHRDIIQRQVPVARPPDLSRVETLSKRTVPVVRIRKQTINIRSQAAPAPPEQVQPPQEPKLKRMVLPDGENRKVEKYAPQVEREVLIPKKAVPEPSPQPEKKQEPEKKEERELKKRTRSD
jgi:hypothetical protein